MDIQQHKFLERSVQIGAHEGHLYRLAIVYT